MLKEKSITLEIISMLVFSILFHLSIIGLLIYNSRISSRYTASKEDKLNFLWVTPVNTKLLREFEKKLPPPIVNIKKVPQKPEEKPKIIEKKEPPRASIKPKDEKAKKNKEEKRKSIADALSNMYDELRTKPAPKPDNYNLKDFKNREQNPLGGQGSPLDPLTSKEIASYKKSVQSILTDNWYIINKSIFKEIKDRSVLLLIKINADGDIVSYELEKSSGNDYYDKSILRAVEKSNPLPPPPDKLIDEVMDEGFLIEFNPVIN